jgi:hypothetical protein
MRETNRYLTIYSKDCQNVGPITPHPYPQLVGRAVSLPSAPPYDGNDLAATARIVLADPSIHGRIARKDDVPHCLAEEDGKEDVAVVIHAEEHPVTVSSAPRCVFWCGRAACQGWKLLVLEAAEVDVAFMGYGQTEAGVRGNSQGQEEGRRVAREWKTGTYTRNAVVNCEP